MTTTVPAFTDAELLDHLLRLMVYGEDLIEACEYCAAIQRRMDALLIRSKAHK